MTLVFRGHIPVVPLAIFFRHHCARVHSVKLSYKCKSSSASLDDNPPPSFFLSSEIPQFRHNGFTIRTSSNSVQDSQC